LVKGTNQHADTKKSKKKKNKKIKKNKYIVKKITRALFQVESKWI
jgi:hypothetical protein